MEIENSLQQLGFSPTETRVYLALLEVGEGSISILIEKTGLHPQSIYNALKTLESRNLVAVRLRRGRHSYGANDPHMLADIFKEKAKKAQEIVSELLQRAKSSFAQFVRVYVGDESFRSIRMNIIRSIPKNDYFYVIGSGGRNFWRAMAGTYERSERERMKLKARKRVIGFEEVRAFEQTRYATDKLAEYRYLPGTYAHPLAFMFGGDQIAIILWGEPVITILLKGKKFVKGYKDYFYVLWKIAKL